MPEKPVHHGRDHRKGGEDPIPGIFGSAAIANLQFSGTLTLTASDNQNIGFTSFKTSDTSVFGTNSLGIGSPATNTSGDTTLLLQQFGLYIAFGSAGWDSGTFPLATFVDLLTEANFYTVEKTNIEFLTTNTFAGTAGLIQPQSIQATWVDSGSENAIRLVVQNHDSSSHTVTSANLSCFYWASLNDSPIASIF
jgi:hypothetical protein